MPAPVAPSPIDPPSAVPDRANRSTFSQDATAFAIYLKDTLRTGVNAVVSYVSSAVTYVEGLVGAAQTAASDAANQVTLASVQKDAATAQAVAAAASATSALNAPGTSATSTTSLTIGGGPQTLTIQTGKAFAIGQTVVIADTAAPSTNSMTGIITAHNSGTGSLTVEVSEVLGSGTKTAWTIALTALRSAIGNGGATASGNVTLLASSAGAQSLTTTGFGQYVTLPDATLCSKNAQVFHLSEVGEYPRGVKNAAGTVLGWIPAKRSVMLGLADNSTAAGVWTGDLEKLAITAETVVALALTVYGHAASIVALDANRTLLLLKDAGTNLYGIVHDNSDGTWGNPALIRSTGNAVVGAIKSATDQALVLSCSTTTAMEAVVLTIAGKTITPETAGKATATLGGNIGSGTWFETVACGASFAALYLRATTTAGLRALSISGTTVSLGAETALTTSLVSVAMGLCALFGVSSSVVLTLTARSGTGIVAAPYTVAGTTLTPGTSATVTTNGAAVFAAIPTGSRWAVLHNNDANTGNASSIVSVSGTTATKSTTGTTIASSLGAYSPLEIAAGKVAVFNNDTSTTLVNILTDASGTASVGTAMSEPLTVTGQLIAATVVGTNLHLVGGATSLSAGAAGDLTEQIIDCSGASPTLLGMRSVSLDRTPRAPLAALVPTRAFGWSAANLMQSGSAFYTPPLNGQRGTYGGTARLGLSPEAGQHPTAAGNVTSTIGKVGASRLFGLASANSGRTILTQLECAA